MNNVVKFEKTNRKLDWKQEEALREYRKDSRKRRDQRKTGRDSKWATDGGDE